MSPEKNMFCDPPYHHENRHIETVLVRVTTYVFFENKKKYLWIILITVSFLELGCIGNVTVDPL